MRIDIRKLTSDELPREKAIKQGIEYLTNHELLAIVLRTGTKDSNVLDLSYEILAKHNGIFGLSRLSYSELNQVKGIKKAKALSLISAFELAKRLSISTESDFKIEKPEQVYEFIRPKLLNAQQERFYVLFLNNKNFMTSYKELFVGGLDRNVIHPRDIFRESVRNNAAKIILVHNHPSGDPTPSKADIDITKDIIKAGEIIGIQIVDHIITGNHTYISLRAIKAL